MAGTAPIDVVVGPRGLTLPLAEFRARLGGARELSRFFKALTVTERTPIPKPFGVPPETRRAYEILDGGRTLAMPRTKLRPLRAARCAGAALIGAAAVRLPAARALAAGCGAGAAPLYAYQTAAVDLLCGPEGPLGPAAVEQGRGVAYLCLDTGLGKSRVGGAVIVRRREAALVVVPTCAIADQWVAELGAAFPRLRAAVHRNTQRRPPTAASHDVVVVVVNTFREKGPAFLAGFGTVILDEAHEYHGPCNSRALWLAQARAVLGLSATPLSRPDGLDRLVTHHLGEPLRPEGMALPTFRGEVRKIRFTSHPDREVAVLTSTGTVSAIATVAALSTDPERQRLIAVEVARLLRRHEAAEAAEEGLGPRPASAATAGRPAGEIRRHGVFVFAELRDHLISLRAALAEVVGEAELFAPELEGGGPAAGAPAAPGPGPGAPTVSVLRGGVRRQDVERAARARVVLTTFGFSRRGISLREMTAIVLASPRRNGLEQITGRILRLGSDESIVRVVVDIVDARSPLRSQFSERRHVYERRGFPVTQIQANWTDFQRTGPVRSLGAGGALEGGPDAAGPGAEPGPPGLEAGVGVGPGAAGPGTGPGAPGLEAEVGAGPGAAGPGTGPGAAGPGTGPGAAGAGTGPGAGPGAKTRRGPSRGRDAPTRAPLAAVIDAAAPTANRPDGREGPRPPPERHGVPREGDRKASGAVQPLRRGPDEPGRPRPPPGQAAALLPVPRA